MCGLFAARIAVRNRDWKNDLVLYTRTLELSPDSYIISNDLGGVYWHTGAWDKAESVWRGVLSRNPNNIDALNNMGLVAGRKKQYSEAAGFFKRVIELKPNLSDPHRNLGNTYRLMGMPGPAERELRLALALSSLDYRVLNELGRLFLEEGRVSEAEDQFRDSIRNEPNVLAYDFLGEIDTRRGALEDGGARFSERPQLG